jgi:hypothetical protein
MKRHVRNFTDKVVAFAKQHAVFLTILSIGLLLRFFFISFQGLSNDELSAWFRTRFDTWISFWQWGVKAGDMHPVLYQFFLHFWLKLWGESEWAIRSLSLLFYVLNSILIQRLGERFFTRQSAWLVNALYAVLTFMVINTTFSRPYNSGVFFLLIAFYAIMKLWHTNEKLFRWTILLSIAFAGAMLSHYFAFLVAAVLGLTAILFLQGKKRWYILASGVISVGVFLPHLSVTLFQMNRGGLGWLAPPDAFWLPEFTWLWLNQSLVVVSLFLLMVAFVLFPSQKVSLEKNQLFSISVAFLSLFAGYVLSYLITPVMRELVMLFILPFLLLPLFALGKFKEGDKSPVYASGAVILVIGLHSIFFDHLYKPVHFGVFRELGEEINAYEKRLGRSNIDFAINTNNVEYLNYYLDHSKEEPIIDWFSEETFDKLQQRLKHSTAPYFCYVFNNQYDQPKFRELIRKYYPVQKDAFVSPGAAVYLFQKGNRFWLHPKRISSKTDLISTKDEFTGEFRIKVKELDKLDPMDYYVIACDLQLFESDELYTVVCLMRNGEMLEKNETPVYYQTIDQRKMISDSVPSRITMPFEIPKDAQAEDEILFYLWNPKKVSFRHSEASLFEVK